MHVIQMCIRVQVRVHYIVSGLEFQHFELVNVLALVHNYIFVCVHARAHVSVCARVRVCKWPCSLLTGLPAVQNHHRSQCASTVGKERCCNSGVSDFYCSFMSGHTFYVYIHFACMNIMGIYNGIVLDFYVFL